MPTYTELKKLYDIGEQSSEGGVNFIAKLFDINGPTMGNPTMVKMTVDRYTANDSGGKSPVDAINDGLQEMRAENDDISSQKKGVRLPLAQNRKPLKEAYDLVNPSHMPNENFNDNEIGIYFYVRGAGADAIGSSDIFRQRLSEKANEICDRVRDSLVTPIREYDAALGQVVEAVSAGTSGQVPPFSELETKQNALSAAITAGREQLDLIATQAEFDAVIAELQKTNKEASSWRYTFAKDIFFSSCGIFSGAVGATASMATGNGAGIIMGLWGFMKNCNKAMEAVILHTEELNTSAAVMKERWKELKATITEGEGVWTAKTKANEVAAELGTFMLGFSTLKSSYKAFKKEYENVVGKSASYINTALKASIELENCLKKLDALDQIINNPEDFGLTDTGFIEKLKNNVSGSLLVGIAAISSKMNDAHKARENFVEIRKVMKKIKAKEPEWIKLFKISIVATEVGLNWAAPDNPDPDFLETFADITGKSEACLSAAREYYGMLPARKKKK